MGSGFEELFEHEFNSHIRDVLTHERAAGRAAYLTFNVLNAKLGAESGSVTIEDELGPHRQATIDLNSSRRMLEEAKSARARGERLLELRSSLRATQRISGNLQRPRPTPS